MTTSATDMRGDAAIGEARVRGAATAVRGQTARARMALSRLLERRGTPSAAGQAPVRPPVRSAGVGSSTTAGPPTGPGHGLYGRGFGSYVEAARSAVALLEAQLPESQVVLVRMSQGAETFTVIDANGETSFALKPGVPVPLHASFAVLVATDQRPILSAGEDEPVFGDLDVRRTLQHGSYVGVPLQLSDATAIGSLCAVARPTRRYGARDLELLSGMAGLLAHVFERDQNERELRRRADEYREHATTDPLTGVTNRRGFLEVLEREWQLSRRGTVSSYLLVADVDGLKAANDRFGHALGDVLLQDVARALTGAARVSDAVGRLGGDEFGVVLIGCDGEADAAAFSSRARDRLALLVADREQAVTLSVGFHALADARSTERALALADSAMYRDKVGRRSVAAPAQASLTPSP